MATHPIIHVWKISWAEEPDGAQSMGPQRVDSFKVCRNPEREATCPSGKARHPHLALDISRAGVSLREASLRCLSVSTSSAGLL